MDLLHSERMLLKILCSVGICCIFTEGALRSSASQNGNEDNRLSNYIRNLAEDLQLEERVEQDLYRDATRDASEPVEDEKLSESLRGINQIVTETTKAIRKLKVLCKFGCKRCCVMVKMIKRGADPQGFCDDCWWCCYIWKIVTDQIPDLEPSNGYITNP